MVCFVPRLHCTITVASFPGCSCLQFLIACSMQKLDSDEGLGTYSGNVFLKQRVGYRVGISFPVVLETVWGGYRSRYTYFSNSGYWNHLHCFNVCVSVWVNLGTRLIQQVV